MNEIIKICKKHGELSQHQVKQGVYKGKKYRKCRFCELERSREYHKRMYDDKEWVDKKHIRDNARWREKKKEITKKRQRPEALKKRRDAYYKNLEKYRAEGNRKQKKYRDSLHDSYIRKIIINSDKNIKYSLMPQSMVDLKRSIMQLRRGLKEQLSLITGEEVNENKQYRRIEKSCFRITAKSKKK